MQKRKLGNSDCKCRRLGFGCMGTLKHYGGTLAGRGQLFGKGVQSWQRSPRDKSRIFQRKSPIFSLSQGPRKSRKIRTFLRRNLRLCSFSDWFTSTPFHSHDSRAPPAATRWSGEGH
jgi:hypothetical protein